MDEALIDFMHRLTSLVSVVLARLFIPLYPSYTTAVSSSFHCGCILLLFSNHPVISALCSGSSDHDKTLICDTIRTNSSCACDCSTVKSFCDCPGVTCSSSYYSMFVLKATLSCFSSHFNGFCLFLTFTVTGVTVGSHHLPYLQVMNTPSLHCLFM